MKDKLPSHPKHPLYVPGLVQPSSLTSVPYSVITGAPQIPPPAHLLSDPASFDEPMVIPGPAGAAGAAGAPGVAGAAGPPGMDGACGDDWPLLIPGPQGPQGIQGIPGVGGGGGSTSYLLLPGLEDQYLDDTAAILGAVGPDGSGTPGTLAKWTSGSRLGDSLVSESGAVVTVAANLQLSSAAPIVIWNESDQAADEKKWRVYADAKTFFMQTLNDAESSAATWLSVARGAGTATSLITLNQHTLVAGNLFNRWAGDTWGLVVTRAAANNYQLRSNDDGSGAQVAAGSPSWAVTIGEGVSDTFSVYRRAPAGAFTLLWSMANTGNFIAGTDNAWDIGNVATGRPRDLNLGRNITAGGTIGATGAITAGTTLAITGAGATLVLNGTTRLTTSRPTWTLATTTVNRAAVTNTTTLANLAQAVGTLINDLRTMGILG